MCGLDYEVASLGDAMLVVQQSDDIYLEIWFVGLGGPSKPLALGQLNLYE
jgi:hypothetical protein